MRFGTKHARRVRLAVARQAWVVVAAVGGEGSVGDSGVHTVLTTGHGEAR